MSDTSEGQAAGQGYGPAAPSADEPSDSQPQRGLLGRLIGALAPPEQQSENARAIEAGLRAMGPSMANLRRLRVADVQIPKAEIVAVPVDAGRDHLIRVFRESGFSRLPVYAETLDRPLGLLLLKDLVLRHGFGLDEGEFDVKALLRPLLFVPPSMPLVVLFQKMQAARIHMALVIDEYGGVEGLVTVEDLLEQVVGEIDDEHDTEDDALWHSEGPEAWTLQARALIEDFREQTGVDLTEALEDEDVDTLGGLVFVLAGRVPVRGEVVAHPAGWEIEVLDADPRRVKRLRLRRAPLAAPGA
jgi:magnesium and cobalt transporter